MKNFVKTGILSLLIIFIGSQTALAQDIFAATDKSLQTDFSKLKTYGWASQAKSDNPNLTLSDVVMKESIRDAIEYELKAKGYVEVEENPDFLVNFRVFDGKTSFPGYVDVYKDENYWTSTELRRDLIGIVPDAEIRQREDMRNYRFNEGTLLIDFVDTETSSRIWTGYASGVSDDYVLDKKPAGINRAVNAIFDKYEFQAFEEADS